MTFVLQAMLALAVFLGVRVLQVAMFRIEGYMEVWWALEITKWGIIVFSVLWVYRQVAELRARLNAIRDMAMRELQEDATLVDVSRD